MKFKELGLAVTAAAAIGSWAFAQEKEPNGRTDHFDTELGLIEYNACKVWQIIWKRDICVEFGYNAYDEEGNREGYDFSTKDGKPVDITYEEFLELRQLWNFEYIKPESGSNFHTLINGQTGERVDVQLREWDTIQEIHGEHILVRSEDRLKKVADFSWLEVFSSDEIFMRWEEWFKKINISELDDEQFDMLIWIVAAYNNIRIVDTSELDFREVSRVFYNATDKDSMIRLMWDNRAAILAKSDYFSQYIWPISFVKDNFDEIEAVVWRLEWKSLLQEDDIWYRQDFRSEYFEAFSQIPWLLEAFWYEAPANIVSNDSIFWETDLSSAPNADDEYQKFKLIRNIQFLYRRLENPITEQMLEWFLKEINVSSESKQESE